MSKPSVRLNLGCGYSVLEGWLNVDKYPVAGTRQQDVDEGLSFLDTSSVVEVRAHHVLEHVRDLDQVMRELHRVCGGGARLDILVPLANTLWAVANPDHRRLFNHRTFQYYTPEFVTSDAGLFRGFTIVAQTIEREPDEWFDGIQWMVANLHVVLQVVK